MSPKKSILAVALSIAGVGSLAGAATAYADGGPTYSVPTSAQLSSLTPAQQDLLSAGDPVVVVMNPTTGDILSVEPAVSPAFGASPFISHHAGCNSGDGCYRTTNSGNTNQGFSGGPGTSTGTWYNRSSYTSGSWTVSACWSGGCGVEIGPNSELDLTSTVTGTSFTIH